MPRKIEIFLTMEARMKLERMDVFLQPGLTAKETRCDQ